LRWHWWTPADLLTFRAGWGFPDDFSLPAVAPLFSELHQGPARIPLDPDTWVARLARIPMLHQPGEAWLYNTGSDVLGVLLARAARQPLGDVLAERLLGPLGMADTGFAVPPGALDRLPAQYRPAPDGSLLPVDPAGSDAWARPPTFPSGAGGLVSTAGDLLAFGRMLLAGGTGPGDRRVLSAEAVRLMTTDHLTAAQRAGGALFLKGQGWGFGGSVDVDRRDPWTVPGRYGWVGGSGTTAHVVPSTGTVSVLLTQREMTGPTPTDLMRDVWRHVSREESPKASARSASRAG
jgi:CubicO group peptidase (beta-lactamase class C family)